MASTEQTLSLADTDLANECDAIWARRWDTWRAERRGEARYART
jgi:hypothetical protein